MFTLRFRRRGDGGNLTLWLDRHTYRCGGLGLICRATGGGEGGGRDAGREWENRQNVNKRYYPPFFSFSLLGPGSHWYWSWQYYTMMDGPDSTGCSIPLGFYWDVGYPFPVKSQTRVTEYMSKICTLHNVCASHVKSYPFITSFSSYSAPAV